MVVRHLSVDCLLGADFLLQHQAVIDCNTKNLQLGPLENITHTLITSVDSSSIGTVAVLNTVDIPSWSILVMMGTVDSRCTACEVLIEPDGALNAPNHLVIARSLSTLYKGSCIASFTPWQEILVITEQQQVELATAGEVTDNEAVDLQQLAVGTHLDQTQRGGLFTLLNQFHGLFSSADWLPGRTDALKHSIITSGQPIHQLLHRTLIALREIVQAECFNKG